MWFLDNYTIIDVIELGKFHMIAIFGEIGWEGSGDIGIRRMTCYNTCIFKQRRINVCK